MGMMRKRKGEKKPFAFYVIIVLAVIISILIVTWLPIPEPYTTPLKTLIVFILIIALAFLGIFLYARQFRRRGR